MTAPARPVAWLFSPEQLHFLAGMLEIRALPGLRPLELPDAETELLLTSTAARSCGARGFATASEGDISVDTAIAGVLRTLAEARDMLLLRRPGCTVAVVPGAALMLRQDQYVVRGEEPDQSVTIRDFVRASAAGARCELRRLRRDGGRVTGQVMAWQREPGERFTWLADEEPGERLEEAALLARLSGA